MTKSRVTNVQVPGDTTPAANEPAQTEQLTGDQQPSSEDGKPEVTFADVGGVADSTPAATATGGAPAIDIEAIRAQARAEAMAELQADIAAARRVALNQPEPASDAARTGRDYRSMRADEINPATLTAPVLTKDGWLCPPAPEKK